MADLVSPRPEVRVTRAQLSERPLLERLLQFYLYDFSEQEPVGSEALDFDAHGGFGPLTPPDDYWTDPDWHAFLIRLGDRLAGFAFVNTHALGDRPVQHGMAEFFIARKFRRHGFAHEAVRQILSSLPGLWEVAVKDANTAAKTFWPKALSAAGVTDLVVSEEDSDRWRGPIWTFSVDALDRAI